MLPSVLARDVTDARGQIQHAPLRDRALHQGRDIRLGVPDSLQATRDAEAVEETRDRLEEVRADRVVGDGGDRRVGWGRVEEDGERLAVPVGRGRGGELEDGGSRKRDTGMGVSVGTGIAM